LSKNKDIIKFYKEYSFEGKIYQEINLEALEDLTAADMIATHRTLDRTGGNTSEASLEYAMAIAARASKQPIEFFQLLPMKEAIKVKNRVVGFLFNLV